VAWEVEANQDITSGTASLIYHSNCQERATIRISKGKSILLCPVALILDGFHSAQGAEEYYAYRILLRPCWLPVLPHENVSIGSCIYLRLRTLDAGKYDSFSCARHIGREESCRCILSTMLFLSF
jgi:hypothetical protein